MLHDMTNIGSQKGSNLVAPSAPCTAESRLDLAQSVETSFQQQSNKNLFLGMEIEVDAIPFI